VPIFNGLQARNRVGMSKIAVEQARLQLEKSKRDIRKTIEQAYADARSAYKSYQAAKLNVEALQQAYNYAEKKFNAGMINSYEFNDAKIKLENARNNLLNAKYNYVFRVKVLDFYFGQPLTF
jgi:outer membrane protein